MIGEFFGSVGDGIEYVVILLLKLAVVGALLFFLGRWIWAKMNAPPPPLPPPSPIERIGHLEADYSYHATRIAELESQLHVLRSENAELEGRVGALEGEAPP